MHFFIPKISDKTEATNLYNKIKKNIESQMGAELSNRQVHALHYRHNGKIHHAVVGEIDPFENEIIISIYFEPLRNVYHICTLNRGVVTGGPALVGGGDVFEHVDFD